MITLIIDSATKILYEALVKDNKVLREDYIKGENDHAKNIVFNIESILNEFNLEVSDIDLIVCGIGPGSYTGVRMAVTVTKMFAAFKNIKVKTISTLNLISTGFKGKTLSLIDARRGNSFCALYENGKEVIKDGLRNTLEFKAQATYDFIATENDFKVDPLKAIEVSKEYENVNALEPNYLQETEAERNLHHES